MVGLKKMKKEAKNFIKILQEFLGENNFRNHVFDENKKVLLPESKS
ncbi:hypothetical protein BMS3Abin03_00789 [bacterium BMS3Abin03]|nr:hypothetical protein BMS3Abin03_00789 [bacterium BMS3Abin03]